MEEEPLEEGLMELILKTEFLAFAKQIVTFVLVVKADVINNVINATTL